MVSIKHKKVLSISDDNTASAAGQVLPSDWNNEHSVSLAVADIIDAGGLTSASLANQAFIGNITVAGSATFSGTAAFLTAASISGTLSVGFLYIGGYGFQVSLSQSVSSGQVLTWDNSNNKWVNATPGALAVGSLTRSTAALVVHGSASFSGKAVFKTALLNEGTTTLSGNVRASTNVDVSATLSVGSLVVAGTATFVGFTRHLAGLDVSATVSTGALIVAGNANISGTLSVGVLQIAGVTITPGSYLTSGSFATVIATYVTSNSMSARFASASLDTIVDVSLSLSVADGHVLTWNNTSNQWINAAVPGASSATKTVGAFVNRGSMTQSGLAVFKSGVTFEGTVSFSATADFTNMIVATLGVTGTASFATLGVTGTASFGGSGIFGTSLAVSATVSCGALTVAGVAVTGGGTSNYVKLGSASFSTGTQVTFSGSWTDYAVIQVFVHGMKVASNSSSVSIQIYTDGGTTPVLAALAGSVALALPTFFDIKIFTGSPTKTINVVRQTSTNLTGINTATANTGIINALQFNATQTMSGGGIIVYGIT